MKRIHNFNTFTHLHTLTSSDSERNSCMMSLSPMTLTEHTRDRDQCADAKVREQMLHHHKPQSPQEKKHLSLYILPFSLSLTFLQVFLQASPTGIQLLVRERERPFPWKFGKRVGGKLSLQVLVQRGKFPVAL